jgi:D-amino-acid oxidase
LQWRFLPDDEVPTFADFGVRYTSISLTPNVYLNWLVSQCTSAGVKILRHTIDHITDAFRLHHSAPRASLVINCTGLGAMKLGGVQDEAMKPIRGQMVIIENNSRGNFGLPCFDARDEDDAERCYIITRPGGK